MPSLQPTRRTSTLPTFNGDPSLPGSTHPNFLCLKLTLHSVLGLLAIVIGFISQANGEPGSPWSWGTSSAGVLSFAMDNNSARATFYNAWLANTPQVLLSFCYMNLNSFCTAIASAQEWNNLGPSGTRKGLRHLPLLAVNTTLHWLLSQTFFLVRIDQYNASGIMDPVSSRSACGVSSLSFVTFLTLFLGLCIAIRTVTSKKLATSLPPATANSLVISAACHPLGEVEPHLKTVQWGVVKGEMVEGYGHCSISSEPVTGPQEGEVYY
ncbi:hypothetical protein EJ07DRAFT_167456 [Lizonia empirigonia]|nr:hypothetical protein EJ07DRAFT_167456 [Lizonia empirigonia]